MKALLAGPPDVVPTDDVPKDTKDANTYCLSPELEQAMSEIRLILWLAEGHESGIARIALKVKEHDGAFTDYTQSYGKRIAARQARAQGEGETDRG